jgi:Flp pilus assembly protein TadG
MGKQLRAKPRKGVIVVLTAVLLVVLLAMVAFSIDIGYIAVVKTQLQAAADSAALAACSTLSTATSADHSPVVAKAQQFAGYHVVGGVPVSLESSDVEFGTWDATALQFTPASSLSNAVRITARCNDSTGGNGFFFGRVLGARTFNTTAQSVATGNPRDICFVIDLSGSMNDDSEPCWSTYELNNELTPQGYPNTANNMMQDVYTDFGFGTFPGTLQYVGAPAGVTADSRAYANLTKNGGYLTSVSIPSTYRISSGDSESTRKTKAYKWMIDFQIATVMPNAKPTPSSATNFGYWSTYLDYIIQNQTVNSGSGTPPTNRGSLPPSQDSSRITSFNNPNSASFPTAGTSERNGYLNKIGYRTYVQFMMDFGRNTKPDGVNYTPLSTSSPDCPYHYESTAGGNLQFPPREQPTHASRRSLIAAVQEVKARNATVPDPNQRDWVSIVTFDTVSGTVLKTALTSDYDAVMQACTTLQAVGDDQSSTATETGMIGAYNHIKSAAQGGSGRQNTQKVVVLFTDGMPNLKTSSNSTVSNYMSAHSNDDWYGGSSSYNQNASIMQAQTMSALNWKVFTAGIGLGCDYDFLDRMSRTGGTADDDGAGPRTSGNPTNYEAELSAIFKQIINNPQVRLVQ